MKSNYRPRPLAPWAPLRPQERERESLGRECIGDAFWPPSNHSTASSWPALPVVAACMHTSATLQGLSPASCSSGPARGPTRGPPSLFRLAKRRPEELFCQTPLASQAVSNQCIWRVRLAAFVGHTCKLASKQASKPDEMINRSLGATFKCPPLANNCSIWAQTLPPTTSTTRRIQLSANSGLNNDDDDDDDDQS